MELHTFFALMLSWAIGLSLGMLGGGGSILAVPVLVYVAGIEARASVAMSLAIVGSTALVGSLLHGRKGSLDLKVAATFGGAGVVGALLGSRLTHMVSGATLLLLFAALMLVVAVLMIARRERGKHEVEDVRHEPRLVLTLLAGAGVGALTGFLGVGGGFLVVPALVLFAGLPMRLAVGTSLLVIAINSAAGFLGHMGESGLPLALTVEFTLAAVAGTFLGERFARRVQAEQLRRMFAYFVLVVGVFLLAVNRGAIF